MFIVARPKNNGSNAPHIDIGTLRESRADRAGLSNCVPAPEISRQREHKGDRQLVAFPHVLRVSDR